MPEVASNWMLEISINNKIISGVRLHNFSRNAVHS